jgi:cytochrome c553
MKNEPRSIRSVCLAFLLAAAGSPAAMGQPIGGDAAQGKSIAQAKCAACHGPDGNSPVPQYPKLAAQDPAYLYSQLRAFKQGTRKSEVMAPIAAALSDAEMADTASFYGRQRRHPDAVKDPRSAALGERIFFSGMPSCATCHASGGGRGMGRGMPMMGMGHGMAGMMSGGTADVPNVDGQHAAYIVDQLDKFAKGERQGTVMNRIAPALSESERKAVAQYLSGAR